MEKGNDGALELRALSGVDRGRAEGLPHDRLANIGGDEERDAGPKAIAFLQELVQQDSNHPREKQLQDDKRAVPEAERTRIAVHAAHHVSKGLAQRDENAEQLLRGREQVPILLQALVKLDHPRSCKQLHDPAGSNDRRNAQFHEGAPIGSQNHSHPVERVGTLRRDDAIHRYLATDQEHEERDGCPAHLLLERHSVLWRHDLRHDP
mmetsp:Transcript_82467/g.229880  ORF Transcript_82467/g.229880 Transcript_82467/m.229880 type:complete len:207 (+) Transcript_82467:830-1450(+)